MKVCTICKCVFRNTYNLDRHLARKFKCSDKLIKDDEIAKMLLLKKENLEKKLKDTNELAELKKKIKTQKFEVIKLTEIKKDIQELKEEVAKLKKINDLENEIKQNALSVVLNFGQTNDKVDTETIIELLRTIVKQDSTIYLMTTNLVTRYDRLLDQTPENKNLIIKNYKCLYAEVKDSMGWCKEPVATILDVSFKDRAKRLFEKRQDIESVNQRVFNSPVIQAIWDCLEGLTASGVESATARPVERRQARTTYKINKIV
jgi:hypothetical protein